MREEGRRRRKEVGKERRKKRKLIELFLVGSGWVLVLVLIISICI